MTQQPGAKRAIKVAKRKAKTNKVAKLNNIKKANNPKTKTESN